MNKRRIEDLVRDHPWPEISPDVRVRVMAAPMAVPESITWSDRLWFSRRWRLSAAAAAIVLVALNQLPGETGAPNITAAPQAIAEARAIEDVAQQAGLPASAASSLASRSLFEASRSRMPHQSVAAVLQILELETPGGM
jgi:hypothetical protein